MKNLSQRNISLALSAAALALNLSAVPQAQAGSFLANSPMLTGRFFHTATLLRNGKVLAAGGDDTGSAELYDPATGTWTATGAMNHARKLHTATLLPDGKVLVVGGFESPAPELYDPATGHWMDAGATKAAGELSTATLLPNGKVLVTWFHDRLGPSTAEIFDPASSTWTPTTPMKTAFMRPTATLLRNGQVFITGGFNHPVKDVEWADNGLMLNATTADGSLPSSAEIYSQTTGRWMAITNSLTKIQPSIPGSHTATMLPNGKVLFVGMGIMDVPYAGAQLYDPASGSWSATGAMTQKRGDHTATLLADGKVLVVGGIGPAPGMDAEFKAALSNAELYDPVSGTWTQLAHQMSIQRYYHTATLLPNGKVLIAGGLTTDHGRITGRSSTELYDPELEKDAEKTSPLR